MACLHADEKEDRKGERPTLTEFLSTQSPAVSNLVERCGGDSLAIVQSSCIVLQQAAQHKWVEPHSLLNRLKVLITAAR